MVSEQLLAYVRDCLARGVARDVVTSTLVANGWSPGDIDAAFLQAHTITKTTPQQGTEQPGRGWLLKVLLVILGVVSVFAFRAYRQPSLRAEIMTIWRSGDPHVAEIKPLREKALLYCPIAASTSIQKFLEPPCLNPETNRPYMVDYIVKVRDVLDAENQHSEQVKAIVDQNWWIVDFHTREQVMGYYDIQHAAPSVKLRAAYATLDPKAVEEGQKEFDAYFKSGDYGGIMQVLKY